MYLALKVVSLFLFASDLIGFGWWDRSELTALGALYWLTPAMSLLIIGVTPFRILARITFIKVVFSGLVFVGVIRLGQDMYASWNSPHEPDAPAILLQAATMGIMVWALMRIWRAKYPESST